MLLLYYKMKKIWSAAISHDSFVTINPSYGEKGLTLTLIMDFICHCNIKIKWGKDDNLSFSFKSEFSNTGPTQ